MQAVAFLGVINDLKVEILAQICTLVVAVCKI